MIYGNASTPGKELQLWYCEFGFHVHASAGYQGPLLESGRGDSNPGTGSCPGKIRYIILSLLSGLVEQIHRWQSAVFEIKQRLIVPVIP